MKTSALRKTSAGTPFKTSALEAARRLGLVGCLDGPPDLARNHSKYVKEILRAKHRRSR